jgi:hypothetical protein
LAGSTLSSNNRLPAGGGAGVVGNIIGGTATGSHAAIASTTSGHARVMPHS